MGDSGVPGGDYDDPGGDGPLKGAPPQGPLTDTGTDTVTDTDTDTDTDTNTDSDTSVRTCSRGVGRLLMGSFNG